MITKLGLYLSEIIICSYDEFSAGEVSASCFSTSFPRFLFWFSSVVISLTSMSKLTASVTPKFLNSFLVMRKRARKLAGTRLVVKELTSRFCTSSHFTVGRAPSKLEAENLNMYNCRKYRNFLYVDIHLSKLQKLFRCCIDVCRLIFHDFIKHPCSCSNFQSFSMRLDKTVLKVRESVA